MENNYQFLKQIIDSITENVVVIDESGNIVFVNESWSLFAQQNDHIDVDWQTINYLEECDKAAYMGDKYGERAAEGIRSVIQGRESLFYCEYPCHSPDEKRWFMMRVSPFEMSKRNYFVISHQNITERKLQENEVRNLARVDSLTGIANRRTLKDFLFEEWRRCARLANPMAFVIIDLDDFKLLNDNYGHQAGDECLVEVAKLLQSFTSGSNELCARYGGEEFALIWGSTQIENATERANQLLEAIVSLNISNYKSATKKYLTASIGLVSMVPILGEDANVLIGKADSLLYKAKSNGKNRVEFSI